MGDKPGSFYIAFGVLYDSYEHPAAPALLLPPSAMMLNIGTTVVLGLLPTFAVGQVMTTEATCSPGYEWVSSFLIVLAIVINLVDV